MKRSFRRCSCLFSGLAALSGLSCMDAASLAATDPIASVACDATPAALGTSPRFGADASQTVRLRYYPRDAGEEPGFNVWLPDGQDDAGLILRPFFTCIRPTGDPGMAILGYENRSALVITVAEGPDNMLDRDYLGSPPTVFQPGLHPRDVAIALFQQIPDSWTLLGITVSSVSSRLCEEGEQAERSTIPQTEVP